MANANAKKATAKPVTLPAFDIAAMAQAVSDAATARGKVAELFRNAASPAFGCPELQKQAGAQLGLLRARVLELRDQVAASMANADARARYVKAVENSLGYGLKEAGTAAGCRFVYKKGSPVYLVKDLEAPGEAKAKAEIGADVEAKGKQAGQSAADLINAGAAAPEEAGKRLALSVEALAAALAAAKDAPEHVAQAALADVVTALGGAFGWNAVVGAVASASKADADHAKAEKARQRKADAAARKERQRQADAAARVLAESGLSIVPTDAAPAELPAAVGQ